MAHDASAIFEALVIGAGPAGIAAIGNLLEYGIAPLCWVDDSFQGGRLHEHYREVPANLKAQGFVNFATALGTFRESLARSSSRSDLKMDCEESHSDKPSKNALNALYCLPLDKECSLSYGADLCISLTHGLLQHPAIFARKGKVVEALVDVRAGNWQIQCQLHQNISRQVLAIKARRIILCTGSAPLEFPLSSTVHGVQSIPLDVALSPTKLRRILHDQLPLKILVVGSSHSAVLAVKNLVDLSLKDQLKLKVRWLSCHDLRYAEWEADKYVARDNTGLKGVAAIWARQHLEPGSQAYSSTAQIVDRIRTKQHLDTPELLRYSAGMDYVVQAIGYKANPLPLLKDRASNAVIVPKFNHQTGGFKDIARPNEGSGEIPGLYGAGIAFPARVYDAKYKFWEQAIGFPAFMRALKAWVPQWRAVS